MCMYIWWLARNLVLLYNLVPLVLKQSRSYINHKLLKLNHIVADFMVKCWILALWFKLESYWINIVLYRFASNHRRFSDVIRCWTVASWIENASECTSSSQIIVNNILIDCRFVSYRSRFSSIVKYHIIASQIDIESYHSSFSGSIKYRVVASGIKIVSYHYQIDLFRIISHCSRSSGVVIYDLIAWHIYLFN